MKLFSHLMLKTNVSLFYPRGLDAPETTLSDHFIGRIELNTWQYIHEPFKLKLPTHKPSNENGATNSLWFITLVIRCSSDDGISDFTYWPFRPGYCRNYMEKSNSLEGPGQFLSVKKLHWEFPQYWKVRKWKNAFNVDLNQIRIFGWFWTNWEHLEHL